jgi:hypothetical protein
MLHNNGSSVYSNQLWRFTPYFEFSESTSDVTTETYSSSTSAVSHISSSSSSLIQRNSQTNTFEQKTIIRVIDQQDVSPVIYGVFGSLSAVAGFIFFYYFSIAAKRRFSRWRFKLARQGIMDANSNDNLFSASNSGSKTKSNSSLNAEGIIPKINL